jgi:hypothetical protein
LSSGEDIVREALDTGETWINTDIIGCIEAEAKIKHARTVVLPLLVAERDEANKAVTYYCDRAQIAEAAFSRYRDENLELENRVEAAEAERDWALSIVENECGGTAESILADCRAELAWEREALEEARREEA